MIFLGYCLIFNFVGLKTLKKGGRRGERRERGRERRGRERTGRRRGRKGRRGRGERGRREKNSSFFVTLRFIEKREGVEHLLEIVMF